MVFPLVAQAPAARLRAEPWRHVALYVSDVVDVALAAVV